MKLIKQSKLLTFQVIVSLIILNTQISFAQNKKVNLKDWEGSYVGIGVANSSSKTEIRAFGTDMFGNGDHYALNNGTKDKSQDEIIFKIGHLEQLNNNILLGIELNKYSDIETSTLNTNTASNYFNTMGSTDRNTLKLKDIISLELKLATVLENQDIFLNNLMIYGKLGVATLRSNQRNTEDLNADHISQSTARHYGSVVGIGIEKKLSIFDDPKISNNTSVSLEYNMMNFNKKTSGSDSGFVVDSGGYSVKPEIKNLLLTINYKLSDNTLGLKNLIK
jgi:opacity protein-like surface antigen